MMEYVNGDVYIGGWLDGLYSGRGSIKYNYGDRYEGDVLHNIEASIYCL